MRPRAKKEFLVGYNSRNIYRIILLDEEIVVGTGDVIFDESLFLDDQQEQETDEDSTLILDFKMIPALPDFIFDGEDIPIRNNEPSSQTSDEEVKNIEEHSEIHLVKSDDFISFNTNESQKPEAEGFAENFVSNRQKVPDNCAIDESNIINGPLGRYKTGKSKELNVLAVNLNVFIVGKANPILKLHQSELTAPPKNWRDFKAHKYSIAFWNSMKVDYNTLKESNTIVEINQTNSMTPIPLRWVYSYKFDEADYLLKFKARICVRGDLQPEIDEENYASTLEFQVFRLLIALITLFDLETIQVDTVNVFCNSPLDDEVYVYNPAGFSSNGKVLRLRKGLYGLRKSPKLWLKLLSGTLVDIGLRQVPSPPCGFTDFKGIIVFFFVDDVVFIFPKNRRGEAQNMLDKLTQRFEFRVL